MQTEYEAKFYPVVKDDIRDVLKQNSGTLVQPEVKTTIAVFNNTANPQIKGDYLRVRDEGDQVRLSVKIHASNDGNLSDQKELDVIVNDFSSTVDILKHAGLTQTGAQEKLRETWKLDNAEVVIDTWPGLEPYIEIEAGSEQDVRRIAELLGFNWDDKIITSVVEIFMKKYGLTTKEVLDLFANTTFDHNPFSERQTV